MKKVFSIIREDSYPLKSLDNINNAYYKSFKLLEYQMYYIPLQICEYQLSLNISYYHDKMLFKLNHIENYLEIIK